MCQFGRRRVCAGAGKPLLGAVWVLAFAFAVSTQPNTLLKIIGCWAVLNTFFTPHLAHKPYSYLTT